VPTQTPPPKLRNFCLTPQKKRKDQRMPMHTTPQKRLFQTPSEILVHRGVCILNEWPLITVTIIEQITMDAIFVRRFRFSGTICSQKIISLLSTIFKGDNILYKVVRYRNYRGKLFRLETQKSKACNAWDYNTRPPCTCMKWWKANSRPPWTVYRANSRGGVVTPGIDSCIITGHPLPENSPWFQFVL
jgi:hypothetical protein